MAEYSSIILPSVEGGYVVPGGALLEHNLDDWKILSQLVYAEARGEPFWGQVAVAAVVLNRLRYPEFPKSLREIIFQPRQFEVVANGSIHQTPNNLAYQAAREALEGVDPTNGSLFFWNPAKVGAASWVWTRTVKLRIGNHVFA